MTENHIPGAGDHLLLDESEAEPFSFPERFHGQYSFLPDPDHAPVRAMT